MLHIHKYTHRTPVGDIYANSQQAHVIVWKINRKKKEQIYIKSGDMIWYGNNQYDWQMRIVVGL